MTSSWKSNIFFKALFLKERGKSIIYWRMEEKKHILSLFGHRIWF